MDGESLDREPLDDVGLVGVTLDRQPLDRVEMDSRRVDVAELGLTY
jgi:hypothetical protein